MLLCCMEANHPHWGFGIEKFQKTRSFVDWGASTVTNGGGDQLVRDVVHELNERLRFDAVRDEADEQRIRGDGGGTDQIQEGWETCLWRFICCGMWPSHILSTVQTAIPRSVTRCVTRREASLTSLDFSILLLQFLGTNIPIF